MNIILSVISIILCFSALVLIEKLFKKEGVYVWMVFATIAANIAVCKNININGMIFTLGNILFASNFLATDILSEKYGMKDSKKGVYLAVVFVIIFIATMQICLLFKPDESDIAQPFIEGLFKVNLRTSFASISMFFLSNISDIYLFDKLKKKIPNKLWLRNNASTILTNCLENFLFCFLAFLGIYDFNLILTIVLTTCLAEIIISLCDTPFIYLSKKLN